MASYTTDLTEFASNGDSRTYTVSGHSVSLPKLVIQKRKVPTGNQIMAESNVSVVYGTVDAAGAVLPQKVLMTFGVRYPVNSTSTAITAALATARDLIASDEWTAIVSSQNFLE